MSKKDDALPSMASPATEVGTADELEMTAADMTAIRGRGDGTDRAVEGRGAAPDQGGSRVHAESDVEVAVNGVTWSLPIGVEVKAAASVVAIARARMDAADVAEESARGLARRVAHHG